MLYSIFFICASFALVGAQNCQTSSLSACLMRYMASTPFQPADSCSRVKDLESCYVKNSCMSRFKLCNNPQYSACGLCNKLNTVTKTASFIGVSKVVVFADSFEKDDAPIFTTDPKNANYFEFVIKSGQPSSTISVTTTQGDDGFKTVTVTTAQYTSVSMRYPQSAQLAFRSSTMSTSGRRGEVSLWPSAAVPVPTAIRGGILLDGMAATETHVLAPQLMEGGVVWSQELTGTGFGIQIWPTLQGWGCSSLVYQPDDKRIYGFCAQGNVFLPTAVGVFISVSSDINNKDAPIQYFLWSKLVADTTSGLAADSRGPNDFSVDAEGNIYFTVTSADTTMGGIYKIMKKDLATGAGDVNTKTTPKATQLVKDFRQDSVLGGQRLNGLVLSLDDTKIYAVENNKTFRGSVPVRCITEWTMNAKKDGVVSKKVIYDWKTGYGGDGIAIDKKGIVYGSAGKTYSLAGDAETLDIPPGVYAVDPATPGELSAFYPGPFNYGTAVCFGGPAASTLIMASGAYFMKYETPQQGTFR